MSQMEEAECWRLLRSACTNVIGFAELLNEPGGHKFSEVKRMQYRAYMIGSALKLADLIVEHDRVIAHSLPRDEIAELKRLSKDYRYLILTLDGEKPDVLENHSREFARYALGVLNH